MPVRSIKLKLILPRHEEASHVTCDLWTTHATVNAAVAYYKSRLLLMRAASYATNDGQQVTEGELVAQLDELIAEARTRNGRTAALSAVESEDVHRRLRALYVAIAPSVEGKEGTAQQANAFLGPLTDAQSTGFLSVFEKIGTAPPWLEGVRNGEAMAFEQAARWAETSEGRLRLTATGSPPTWVRKYRRGEADWPAAFVADFDRKAAEAEGVPATVRRLKDLGVLPLFPPYVAPQIRRERGASVLSPWDRLAFRLAVGHLLSWESWCKRARNEHDERRQHLETFRARWLSEPQAEDRFAGLRRYEAERHRELAQLGLSMRDDEPFRITLRMVRGWQELRERWMKAAPEDAEARQERTRQEQTRLRGRFGDPHLFTWLAQPAQVDLWRPEPDLVGVLARLNAMEALVERSRDTALMTLPDAIAHPRSVQWEAEGGSNLRNYRLAVEGEQLTAVLPLLRADADGLREVDARLALAPSGQMRRVCLTRDGKTVQLAFKNGADATFTAALGSADLLLDWNHLRHRPIGAVAAGDIGPAWLKLALDLEAQWPEGSDGKRPKAVNHFLAARGNDKHAPDVCPGLRVLSVDLGLRTFATCSVFELRAEAPADTTLAFPVAAEPPLWAVHERSFRLRLPDEDVDRAGAAWRQAARQRLRGLRRGLRRYRQLYALGSAETPAARELALDEWRLAFDAGDGWPWEQALFACLETQRAAPSSLWHAVVAQARADYQQQLGLMLGAWRRQERHRDTRKSYGKSSWALEYLSDVRRLLVSWSLLGHAAGAVRRLDRARRGSFAAGLLAHLDGIRSDRLKTGADLIVQAARGYQRDAAGQWVARHAPCPVVLFEDLSRYRMRTDRPRRENSQLMRWAHRSVPLEVDMQGALYGITTCDTGAAFSSRFHARTHTPGLRCHALTRADLADSGFRERLAREYEGLDLETLRPGDLVALGGGELFVCVTADDRLLRVHADINAAQNLQRRFWTRHADAFRLPAHAVTTANGTRGWLPSSLGKRLSGALGGPGWLQPTGHDSDSCRWQALSARDWRQLGGVGARMDNAAPADDALAELEGLAEEAAEHGGQVTVFFRDPSGVILPANLWYPGKLFWSIVRRKTLQHLYRVG